MRMIAVHTPRGQALETSIPESHRERARGLLTRTRLDPGEALLNEQSRSVHTFGMRFPITVAFVDRAWRVIRVVRSLPGHVLFCPRARHILECHIGADIRVGDVLTRRGARGSRTTRDARGTGPARRT